MTIIDIDNDYDPGPYDISFNIEDTKYLLNISITDDIVLEESEEFILNVNPILLPDRVTIGSIFETRVIIIDNDRKLFKVMAHILQWKLCSNYCEA